VSGCLPVPFWASGHGVREGAGNVCCEWRGTRDIGQGSKLQECAVSTGAGYGTGTRCGGERQFPLRRFDDGMAVACQRPGRTRKETSTLRKREEGRMTLECFKSRDELNEKDQCANTGPLQGSLFVWVPGHRSVSRQTA